MAKDETPEDRPIPHSVERKETLTDYTIRKLRENGIQAKKEKLPKGWCRVIFMR
jgi:hypothetical protein